MDFQISQKTQGYLERLGAFMDQYVYPNEERFYAQLKQGSRWDDPPLLEELKDRARAAGLWNLFLPDSTHGAGLNNLEYAPLSEMMGRVRFASEIFNCSAPDTGNMEVLERYGTAAQKKAWLEPLLAGEIRSAFAMTEPRVASSDATNIESAIVRDGDSYVINGRKWWTSGAGSPRCRVFIFMGKTDPAAARHQQQSMILVPRDTARHHGAAAPAGVRLRRRPARAHGDRLQGRARAGGEHPAGRGPRLRDRAGPAGARAHPPRHAHDRRRRARRLRRCAGA